MTKDRERMALDEVQAAFEEMRTPFPHEWLVEFNVTAGEIHEMCELAAHVFAVGREVLNA